LTVRATSPDTHVPHPAMHAGPRFCCSGCRFCAQHLTDALLHERSSSDDEEPTAGHHDIFTTLKLRFNMRRKWEYCCHWQEAQLPPRDPRDALYQLTFFCCTNKANRSRVSLRNTFSNCHVLFRYLHRFYFCTRIVALGTTIVQRACNAVRVSVSSTDFRTTNLAGVKWTVTVTNQRRLPPVLLMTPRITPPAHRSGREPPWRMDIKVSNSKSDLQGH